MRIPKVAVAALLFFAVVGGIVFNYLVSQAKLDAELRRMIANEQIEAFQAGPAQDQALVKLGQALFFDKILSGSRDISCATCHHPTQGSGDGLVVSIGTGGLGLGPRRQLGYNRALIPRNAPQVFNRGAPEWNTMFWDSRVQVLGDGSIVSPAREKLPTAADFDSVLAIQAMFPVTSRDEMRGHAGDLDVYGVPNELAIIEDTNLPLIWQGLMQRLLQEPGYVALFQAAYPDVPVSELGFQHAANAMAAFQIEAYTFANSPWDRYVRGEADELSAEAKQGALLFFGSAGCASCHTGPLFTDQQHHNIATPQVGPGKGAEAPNDHGRYRETHDPADMYAFRTPPLHNVTISGPWMHDGAFNSLEAVIWHHIDPRASLYAYDVAVHLPANMAGTYVHDETVMSEMVAHIDPLLAPAAALTNEDVDALLAFLATLTDPAVQNLAPVIPASVPSGLPVNDEIEGNSSS